MHNIFYDLPEEIHIEKKYMSKVFYGYVLAFIISYVIILSFVALLHSFDIAPEITNVLITVAELSLMPLIFVLMKSFLSSLPDYKHPVMDTLTPSKFASFFAVSVFVMVIGNVIGNYVNNILEIISGNDMGNIVEAAISDMSFLEIFISVVVFAPIFEELVFRKLFIDKLSKYGTSFCVVISGVVFGFVHGNFQQFFYAAGIGMIFAYIYCIYGKILYTILLHAAINFIGSLLPLMLSGSSQNVPPPLAVYMFIYIFVFGVGGAILVFRHKKTTAFMVGGVLLAPGRSLIRSSGFYVLILIGVLEFFYMFFL